MPSMDAVDPKAILGGDNLVENFAEDDVDMGCVSGNSSEHQLNDPFRHWTPDAVSSRYWRVAEERLLTNLVRSGGKSWREIAQLLPNRKMGTCCSHWKGLRYLTPEALKTRWEKMSLAEAKNTVPRTHRNWTAEEDEFLIDCFRDGSSWSTILEKLPGRSQTAIYWHFNGKLKPKLDGTASNQRESFEALSTTQFPEPAFPPSENRASAVNPTPDQHALLVAQTSYENSNTGAEAEADAVVTEQSVELKSSGSELWSRLGIPVREWTTPEEQTLVKMRGEGSSWKEISKALSKRTARAVESHWRLLQKADSKRHQRKTKQWKTNEKQLLKQMKTRGADWKEIAQALPNRTYQAIVSNWRDQKQKQKQKQLTNEVNEDGAEATLSSQTLSCLARNHYERVKAVTRQQTKTKWRHAMRHPKLATYRNDVEAMAESNFKLWYQDRLRIIDETDAYGTIEQKKTCLDEVLANPRRGIVPRFYNKQSKVGTRYPGDEGPDPQVETDYESMEEAREDAKQKVWEPMKYKRGRHKERRRANMKETRGRRRLFLALNKDHRLSTYTTKTYADLNALGDALQQQWPTSLSFKTVVDLLQNIRDGSEPEVSLLTLDVEFISVTRRALEVAVGEFSSGKVLLDSRIDNQCSTEQLLQTSDGRPLTSSEQARSFATLEKVFGSRDPANCADKKTPREIADVLKNAGVNKRSIILVWHTNCYDLTLLRELFNSAGCDDFLPPNENCIPLIHHFRKGLPPRQKGKMFTCRLDQLFPVLFAGHDLVGSNHSAAPDIKMLRLMALLLIQLQKPLSRRELDDFPKTTQDFIEYAQPPMNFLDRWLKLRPSPDNGSVVDEDDEMLSDEDCGEEDFGDEHYGEEDFYKELNNQNFDIMDGDKEDEEEDEEFWKFDFGNIVDEDSNDQSSDEEEARTEASDRVLL